MNLKMNDVEMLQVIKNEWGRQTDTLLECCQLNNEQHKMMQQWSSKNNWSTRVQMKVLRLARTISNLSDNETITNEAIWEAVTMRRSQTPKVQKGLVK